MSTRYTILVDNGHGCDTCGKRSPDGTFLEYAYSRQVAAAVVAALSSYGHDARLLVPEDNDVPLSERVRRANAVSQAKGAAGVVLVSIHVNAAGNGTAWQTARGWQVCLAPNASLRSMTLAENLADAAARSGLKVRRPRPTQKAWTQNLAICRDTRCPAVLTENLFMDNRDDLAFLMSEEGFRAIVTTHVQGIIDYMQTWR